MWNEHIYVNVVAILSIGGQGNRLIGNYMSSTLYMKIFLTPIQKTNNPGVNLTYPIGSEQESRESINNKWERDIFEFLTRKNFQHTIKKQIIAVFLPEFIKEKITRRKDLGASRAMK